MRLSTKTQLFLILFGAGFAGVLSLLLIDLAAVVALIPMPEANETPTITPALKLLTLIQPSVLLALAVLVGVALGPKVRLSAPFAEAIVARSGAASALRSQLIPGLVGGLLGGVCVVLTAAVVKPILEPETVARLTSFGKLMPVPTRLLYGGLTEELLLRWGFMTLLVWAAWRIFRKQQTSPARAYFIGAILVSSLVFGIGHLPIAVMLIPNAGLVLVLTVIIANSVFGLIAGYLYWKKGLESAMIAHMMAHLVMFAASRAGLYF